MNFFSVVPIVLMMIWFYFLDKSPRWQLTNNKVEDAEQTLRKALKMRGKSDDGLKEQLSELASYLKKVSFELCFNFNFNLDLSPRFNQRMTNLNLIQFWIF